MIIVDAGPLVTIANDRDQHHEKCLILRGSVGGSLRALGAGELELIDLRPDDYTRAAELVRQYADLPLGAVDACVVAVAERLGATEVATLDRRHFSVVRPKHVGGFTLRPD